MEHCPQIDKIIYENLWLLVDLDYVADVKMGNENLDGGIIPKFPNLALVQHPIRNRGIEIPAQGVGRAEIQNIPFAIWR